MDIIKTCPLGSQCEEIKDNKIHRCRWFIEIEGKSPQSEDYVKENDCAIAWMPVLSLEIAQTNRGQTAALCSMRDESSKRQDLAIGLVTKKLQ